MSESVVHGVRDLPTGEESAVDNKDVSGEGVTRGGW